MPHHTKMTNLSLYLSKQQSQVLKRLAFLTGQKSTGTKKELCGVLEEALPRPRLPTRTGNNSAFAGRKGQRAARVLSVDMGVKNLAFCVLDVRQELWKAKRTKGGDGGEAVIEIAEWKRLDLTARLREMATSAPHPVVHETNSEEDAEAEDDAIEILPAAEKLEQAAMYTPSSLSKIAYTLTTELLSYTPDVVLIERQRFRSGGAPQIQEWTVRVNMLESMLWACFETLRHSRSSSRSLLPSGHGGDSGGDSGEVVAFPEVVEMSPKRIGSFWLGREREASLQPADIRQQLEGPRLKDEGEKVVGKKSLEKKDKIALVKNWIREGNGDVGVAESVFSVASVFRKTGSTKKMADAAALRAKTGSGKGLEELARPGKLDDLADCVVQGVTFALWEENRRRAYEYCSSPT